MPYPIHRPRRLRRTAALRDMVRETHLAPSDFIYPLFVVEGRGVRRPIGSMPGIFNLSVDAGRRRGAPGPCARRARRCILFGIPDTKDAQGSQAYASEGIVQRAIREIKSAVPELQVIADVCLCEYTDHGHCGVIEEGHVANDATLPLLARMAVTCAQAGADIIAPSDMMDGRVERHPPGARRGAPARRAHPLLRGQVRLGLLRPLPRGRPEHAPVRRPADPPDGPGQRARGPQGGGPGPGGGRGHDHGQAGAVLPGCHPPGARAGGRAGGGLQRVGRVRHGEGRGPAGLDRRGSA